MTTWWHHPTILTLRLNRRLATRISCILLLCIALITTLFFSVPSQAAPGVNQTIGFQGRLLDVNGDIVPNGYYNIQFKIYEGGSGELAGNPDGDLKWTETYINNGNATGAVEVKNGFLSVNLGSVNPFGDSIDWNQDTLWLSMNVAGASTSCTTFGTAPCAADGEMLPMKRLTATPYAINSGKLGGISADGFIQNTALSQTGEFNLTGTGRANTLQGNTSVIAPLFDVADSAATLSIGSANAGTITIGSASSNQTINIGTGDGEKIITIGSDFDNSSLALQGGEGGVRIDTKSSFKVRTDSSGYDNLDIDQHGNIFMHTGSSGVLAVRSSQNSVLFDVNDTGNIVTGFGTELSVKGGATFEKGLTIQGTGGLMYTTPNGAELNTAINIPNYELGPYTSVLAFGLPSTSAATARGLLVADARTGAHQATIGVLSPDENNIMGFSWNGSNSTGAISNTGNSLALQGNGLNLLTATNNNGAANVGIGNAATSGFALDVTGDVNSSSEYRIGGNTMLTASSLAFGGSSTSSINSANGQSLNINSSETVNIQTDGATRLSIKDAAIQIGDGTDSGQPTLITLDKGSAAPSLTGAEYLGSMYYDTTLGKVQCYEADGWGGCSSSPDTYVNLTPAYTNAVTSGAGTGTMSTDFCSDALNINDGSSGQPTYCGTNQTQNMNIWNSSSGTLQTKNVYINYQLPANFKQFVSGSTSLVAARTSSTLSTMGYQIYKLSGTTTTACGTEMTVAGTGGWETLAASGSADPANCSFAAGDTILFKLNYSARSGAAATSSSLKFAYNDN